MGIWTGVKLGASLLFGPSVGRGGDAVNLIKTAKDAYEPVLAMIDEKKFTDEERSKAFGEGLKNQLALIKASLEESTERSRTRRMVALWIMRIWMASGLFYLFCSYKAMASEAWELKMIPSSLDVFVYASYGFFAVVSFFLGSHMLRGALDRLGGLKGK